MTTLISPHDTCPYASAIHQVKSLKTPPKGVKLTMEVCCIMFDVKPIKVKDPDSGKKVRALEDSYGPCQFRPVRWSPPNKPH